MLITLPMIPQIAHSQFTDGYASTEAEQYVDELKKYLGQAEPDDNFNRDAAYLVRTFSRTDKLNIPPDVVIKHIQLSQSVKNKYYSFIPYQAYQEYLLALRIRYERTAHSNWRQVLHEILNPLVKDAADIDQTANIVFQWLRKEVRLEDEGNTYPIGTKGDLDPLTTLKGKAGTEIDLAILGVAALRSVGIASRIVMAPAIANEKGGKIWLEYRSKEDWKPWVPSAPADSNHLTWLQKQFGKNFSAVVSNAKTPQNITPRYTETFPIWFCPDPLTPNFDVNFCIIGNTRFLVINGKDLMNDLPRNLDYGFGFQLYLITFGYRKTMWGYKLVDAKYNIDNNHRDRQIPAWYIFSFKQKKQFLKFSKDRPKNFEWKENIFRKYFENW
ncbi:MAG: transglutaminase-like domain-containing protein [Verrucomicrobiales bacterium]|nr:transglutaminase-like domain-containing protein [Verrucomicrobiales bacterium]